MITKEFKNAYAKLNPRQKEAVDAIEGPVMVIAGPGTGKTGILALRAANILAKTDTAPENILALTFTESAAANMRERLVALIGSAGYYVDIATFHSYANRLIQEYPEYFPEITGSRNATDVDQISILREILTAGDFEELKPWGDKFFYVDDITASIKAVKQEGYGPAEYRKLVLLRRREAGKLRPRAGRAGRPGRTKLAYEKALADIRKNAELAEIYAAYEAELRRRKLYDYEDMILIVSRALAGNKNFLLEAQEKAQYILVDEHQDTNGAQNRLLELLASFHPRPNLFVVGDEKQAIYRFQGASLENFLYFRKKYPRAKLVYLTDNYRSTQGILDSAQSLIEHNAATIRAPLKARLAGRGRPVEIAETETPEGEYFHLAEEIKKLLAGGVPPAEIAVLYRENRDAEPAAEVLERAGIPVTIESDRNLLSDPDIQKLLRLLRAVDEFGDDEKLAAALHVDFLGIPPLDVWKLLSARAARRGKPLLRLLSDRPALAEMELAAPDKLRGFLESLEHWRQASRNENLLVFFENFIRESGFLAHILKHPGYFEKTGKLNALFAEIKEAAGRRGDYTLRDFMAYLTILSEHRVPIRARAAYEPNRVRLMTAHRAKGLEFDYVFILDAADGKWGNKRRRQKIKLLFRTAVEASELEKNEDERRLFYMALTRARRHAVVLLCRRNADGRTTAPSQFLEEIRPELKTVNQVEETAEKAALRRDLQFAPRRDSGPRIADREFLRALFRERGFSVSALNNYLECPWKYFYVSLLRLPQAETPSQLYGSAVHAALQKFFAARAAGESADKKYLLARYAEALGRMPLAPGDAARLLKQGRAVLTAYHAHYSESWNYRTLTEYKIKGVALSPDVVLNGKLDKLEFAGAPDEVIVVDYKTKQPESRNWIEGKTASSRGDYFRQLVFYKVLLDGEKKFRMKKGVIDFVEPNGRGFFKKEEFEISAAEAAELKKQILAAAEDILNLGFWSRTCGEADCEYCALRPESLT